MKQFGRFFAGLALAASVAVPALGQSAEDFTPYKKNDLRLPSVPLLVNDPFFSIWSNYDTLNGGPTRHWSEREKAINGLLRVDGVTYRFMGTPNQYYLDPIAALASEGTGWKGRVHHSRLTGTDWTQPSFDDSSWTVEDAAWGTPGEYPSVANEWKGENTDIYVRRSVSLTADDLKKELWLKYSHDDVFELYINGTKVVGTGETWVTGVEKSLKDSQSKLFKEGENIIAAHCHNTTGGAYIDFGIYANKGYGADTEQAKQNSVDVMATSSYYNFTCGPVDLDLVFTAPLLIDDFDLLSTPINYVSYQVKSNDGKKHDVQFYLATSAEMTVNENNQPTISETVTVDGIEYLKAGAEEQNILGRSGDMIAIDWGYLYIPAVNNGTVSVASCLDMESTFAETGKLAPSSKTPVRSNFRGAMPALAYMKDLGSTKEARSFMLIGYDEIYDMQYMHKNYKAYYARNGKTIFKAFKEFRDDYSSIMQRCRDLDKRIYDDGLAAGNVKYAEMLAGNYRLVMAAHKLFQDDSGKALYFSKENKSNGCVNTVDLTYPECPLYLVYNPELQKGMILSILDYALSDERKGKNCAAHDLGQYPLANGQVYGDSMPLEESANIIILANAICRITGDGEWLKPYRNVLKTWADYCYREGQNPGNQLCTDDFKGPSEQNTNLSIKAINAVAAYAELVPYIGGNSRDIERFRKYAADMALLWEADARDGDHYRMEFHRPGTWSQKYNLVWDRLWGYNNFPAEVAEREVAFYLNHQQRYGLPLDSRDLQTKLDWILWTACLADDTDTFLQFSDLAYKYIDETTSRIPLSDYFFSDNGRSCNFSARSVIGGLWMKVLKDKIQPKAPETFSWSPKGNHIKTRWAAQVDPDNVLAEYPRPLMQRADWLNLNGLWDYAITDQNGSPAAEDFSGEKILVPFAIESSLSGVMKPLEPGKALWYRREVSVPQNWDGSRIILNFGAVDYQASVYVGGIGGRYMVATHTGGHSSFSADITNKVKDGKATIYVKVIDNTDERAQPVGKQRRYPNGGGDIFYTATSGIWQTVWMEPVDKSASIADIRTTADVDNATMKFDIALDGTPKGDLTVTVLDGGNVVATKTVPAAKSNELSVSIAAPKLWFPASPFLYDVEVTLANGEDILDSVTSYAAMRKISYRKTDDGYWRLQLNNEDLFHYGLLDQGYWPDGLMTAPTDEALAYDIVKTRDWGFNMIRKHMKVEPARWYYHCDRLGVLVWQDMPASYRSDEGWVTDRWHDAHNCSQDPTLEKNYKEEWKEIIGQLYSHPSIVVWTPFNESWGQFKTAEIVDYTISLDNTRLVNPASGGNHYKLGEGTFVDQHTYNQPINVIEAICDPARPFALGEYGGLGRNMPGNRWFERNSQTYNTYTSEMAMTDAFVRLANQLVDLANGYENDGKKINYCAAVYTQTTDVETEVNGVMTYDREVVKFNEPRLFDAVSRLAGVYGTPSGVENIAVENPVAKGDTLYFTPSGIQLAHPAHGLNIVKEADGTVSKVFIR